MSKRPAWPFVLAVSTSLAILAVMEIRAHADGVYEPLGVLTEVLRDIETQYVEEVPQPRLVHNAVVGMLDALDGDSELIDPQRVRGAQGKDADVGLVITRRHDTLTVVAPLDDTPSQRAGLAAGDTILKIDGLDAKTMERSAAAERLRGKAATTVTLTIMRQGWDDPRVLTLIREPAVGPSVTSRDLGDGITYLRVHRFAASTGDELGAVLSTAPARGLLLDLRNDPGGSASDAVDLVQRFLEPGRLIVYREGRRPEFRREFYGSSPGPRLGVPMVVLVNEGSAAAAEMAAGALQDWRRAVIVGARTFGEASAQSVISLPEGPAVRLTTARYFTPRQHMIDGHGITPDIEVAPRTGVDAQFQRALEVLKIAQVITAAHRSEAR
jgi:carboxyl-terminal processing protease